MAKKPTSVFLSEDLVKDLDEWRASQPIFMSRTSVITFAIKEFLKKKEVENVKN